MYPERLESRGRACIYFISDQCEVLGALDTKLFLDKIVMSVMPRAEISASVGDFLVKQKSFE